MKMVHTAVSIITKQSFQICYLWNGKAYDHTPDNRKVELYNLHYSGYTSNHINIVSRTTHLQMNKTLINFFF